MLYVSQWKKKFSHQLILKVYFCDMKYVQISYQKDPLLMQKWFSLKPTLSIEWIEMLSGDILVLQYFYVIENNSFKRKE